MLPPLMPKPLKSRCKMEALPVRELPRDTSAAGDLRAPLRVLGHARPVRVVPSARRVIGKGSTDAQA